MDDPTAGPRADTILISVEQIQRRVHELADEIDRQRPPGEPVHLISVLKGSFVFLADLIRAMRGPVTLDFIALASYAASTTSSGEIQLLKDLDTGIEGRSVLIVEDIVDTGLTLAYLQDILRARAPQRLRSVCLLSKPSQRKIDVTIEYVGFDIEDRFVVGYGLDYAQQFRNLPHIAVLEHGDSRAPVDRPP